MATTAGNVIVHVGTDLAGFNRGMGTVERRLGNVAGTARARYGAIAAYARTGLVLGAAAAFSYTVKQAASFESSLNTLQAVTGATRTQMARMGALAKQLGADVSLPATSASDAAAAMTELAKGGLSVRDTMAAARGVLQLSAAAQISNADAAQITARSLNAFGLRGNQATRVADVLANAANASTGEIADFALGLQQSSAIARQTGLSINETVAALMELADAGIVGSDAGTSLRVMLGRLSGNTKKARGLMSDLGIDVYDAQGRFVGIEKAIESFQRGLSRLNPEQRASAIRTIFGEDAARAANIVLGQGVDKFSKYVALTERQGAAASLAEARMKGFNGSLQAFRSSLETLAITLGTDLLPPLTRAMQALTQFVNWIELNFPRIRAAMVNAFTVVSPLLNNVFKVLQGYITIIQGLIDGDWSMVWGGLKAVVVNAFKGLLNYVRLQATVLWAALRFVGGRAVQGFASAIGGIAASIRSAITAALAKVAGLVTVVGNFGRRLGSSLVSGILSAAKTFGVKLLELIVAPINAIIDKINAIKVGPVDLVPGTIPRIDLGTGKKPGVKPAAPTAPGPPLPAVSGERGGPAVANTFTINVNSQNEADGVMRAMRKAKFALATTPGRRGGR